MLIVFLLTIIVCLILYIIYRYNLNLEDEASLFFIYSWQKEIKNKISSSRINMEMYFFNPRLYPFIKINNINGIYTLNKVGKDLLESLNVDCFFDIYFSKIYFNFNRFNDDKSLTKIIKSIICTLEYDSDIRPYWFRKLHIRPKKLVNILQNNELLLIDLLLLMASEFNNRLSKKDKFIPSEAILFLLKKVRR